MTETLARIVSQLDSLSQQERGELAHLALLSLEPEDADVEAAWDEELVRRLSQIRSGEAVGIPAEQVFAAWRERP